MLSPPSYDGIRWTFASVAAVLTIGRFYVRWRLSRIYWDDLFCALAVLCLITSFACTDVYLNTDDLVVALKYELATALTFWTTFYLVKASFLALCWLIFQVSDSFRKAWWVVAIYTFLTYWPVTFWGLWQCGNPRDYANADVCTNFMQDNLWFLSLSGAVATALHISSDIFILALPLFSLRKLHLSTAQKLSAAGVFALIIIDIIMGLLRNIAVATVNVTSAPDVNSEIINNLEAFEPGLAVVVCALPAYKVLLPNSHWRRDRSDQLLRDGAQQQTPPRQSKSRGTLETSDGSTNERGMINMV